MLILTRRFGESIKIGENITVTILDLAGTQVRIGFVAPKEIPIHRSEVFERIKRLAADQGNDPPAE